MASGDGPHMIRTILGIVLALFLIGVILFWIVTGGISRAWRTGIHFTNPISVIFGNGTTTGVLIHLPWQIETTRGPDISDYVGIADGQLEAGTQADTAAGTSYLQQFGTPSPYVGAVTIVGNNATASDPTQEYIVLHAAGSGPVDVTGWVLQSAVSGAYGVIPPAASVFVGGVVNRVERAYLAPDVSAVVTTGASPVGVSFKETRCTGYLNQHQRFSPELNESCPEPSDALPQTAQNLRVYGASCFDYVANLSSCRFAGASLPGDLTSACRIYIANDLSYNGCVEMYRNSPYFALNSWRLFFSISHQLWNNSHDIIRLLDAQGRVVDVLSY